MTARTSQTITALEQIDSRPLTSNQKNLISLAVVGNISEFFDMFLIGTRIKRRIHFMAKAELFENPLLGWILRRIGAFPVHRGKGDAGSVKMALAALS